MKRALEIFLDGLYALSPAFSGYLWCRIDDWDADWHVQTLLAAADVAFTPSDILFSTDEQALVSEYIKRGMLEGDASFQGLIVLKFLEHTASVDLQPPFLREAMADTRTWTLVPFLLRLCAQSERIRAETCESLRYHDGDIVSTVLFGSFAHTLTDEAEPFSNEDLRIILDYMERGMVQGDEKLSTIIATGFVEAVVNTADVHPYTMQPLLARFGPECRAYADAWDRYSGVKPREW